MASKQIQLQGRDAPGWSVGWYEGLEVGKVQDKKGTGLVLERLNRTALKFVEEQAAAGLAGGERLVATGYQRGRVGLRDAESTGAQTVPVATGSAEAAGADRKDVESSIPPGCLKEIRWGIKRGVEMHHL